MNPASASVRSCSAGTARDQSHPIAESQPSSRNRASLLGPLDTFGRDLDAERVPHRHDRLHDRDVGRRGIEVIDERLVEFQHVDRELLEVRERRVAGTEVVDRDSHSERAQLVQLTARERRCR